MKIKINKKILCDCLKKIAPIATLNRAGLVQSNLFLKTQGNGLIITASNSSIGAETTLGCRIEEQGSALVNASKFSAICETFKKKITLIIEDNNLILCENLTKIKIPVCNDDYPKNNFTINNVDCILIEGKTLKTGITKTIGFTSNESGIVTRGVNFNINNGILKICATDSYCISCFNAPIKYPGEADFTLSKEFLKLFLKCCNDEDIKIYIAGNKIKFEAEKFVFITTIIAGIFPKYQAIINKHTNDNKPISLLSVKKQDLDALIKRVSVLAQKDKPAIKFGCKTLTKVSYLNVFSDVLTAEYKGNELSIRLSLDILSKAINVLDEPTITFEMSSGTSPVFIYENGLTLLMAPII